MTKVYKENLIRYLTDFADYSYQKRVWVEGSAKPGDTSLFFSEGCCAVFDDTGLGDALKTRQTVFDKTADQALWDLWDATHKVDYKNKPDSAIIDTPAMQLVRDKAATALQLITQKNIQSFVV